LREVDSFATIVIAVFLI